MAHYGVSVNQVVDIHNEIPQLQMIYEFLRSESQNRVIRTDEFQLYECISICIHDIISKTRDHPIGSPCDTKCINTFVPKDCLKPAVVNLLKNHPKQFESVLDMLVDNVHIEGSNSNKKQLFDMFISDCENGSNSQIYTKLLLYAVATCINTPIYILCINEIGKLHWDFYQPLFSYEEQARHCIRFITMYMSPLKMFYRIDQHDLDQETPKATGQLGLYLELLKDTPILEIDVPNAILNVSTIAKSNICQMCDQTVVKQCGNLFKENGLIDEYIYRRITTTHRAPRRSLTTFQQTVAQNGPAFKILCQVLIHRHEKRVISANVGDWQTFVSSCIHLKQFEALVDLDNAVYKRNLVVTNFVSSCQQRGHEIDERRRTVTTTVIASSSAGILSGGLVIAGIILAPATFGVSLGLSIAGGAIGVGSGIASGTARAVEAVKQSKNLKHIKTEHINMQEEERSVTRALHNVETVFGTFIRNDDEEEDGNFGDSRRGIMAAGSAFRASHGGIGIGLVASRLAASTTALSAAILGPLSLLIDIAFLAEAAHNKVKGDITNSGEILRNTAETIETKSKIFNSMLRGNCDENRRILVYQ